jgi:5-formyltetrahydrofolate cyclo-ligase
MDVRAQKRSLRREMVARILAMDPDDRRAQEVALAGRLAELPGFAAAGTVLLYVTAFAEELDTRPMLETALRLGKRLVCPRVDRPARWLRLHAIEDLEVDLVPGGMGIPEPAGHCTEVAPEAIDWVLVPGLAFDRRGFRLGRGGGYYDRLLPTLPPTSLRWALALTTQCVDSLPTEPHDAPLDGVVRAGAEWRFA